MKDLQAGAYIVHSSAQAIDPPELNEQRRRKVRRARQSFRMVRRVIEHLCDSLADEASSERIDKNRLEAIVMLMALSRELYSEGYPDRDKSEAKSSVLARLLQYLFGRREEVREEVAHLAPKGTSLQDGVGVDRTNGQAGQMPEYIAGRPLGAMD